MSQETDRTVQSPFCERLRSKKYYFLNTIPTTEDELVDASNHCWCAETQQAVGPDGFVVVPEDCKSARPCYVSAI